MTHATPATTPLIHAILHRPLHVMTQHRPLLPLLPPTIFHPVDLQSNNWLTYQIILLINDAFARSQAPEPWKWPKDLIRFSSPELYLHILVGDFVVALIYDQSEGERVVACACAVPWKGG
jgi:hypothetical protein